MILWTALTRSGTRYERMLGGILVGGALYYRAPRLRVFPAADLGSATDANGGVNWKYMDQLPLVDAPVVGDRMYITTFTDVGWRISTEVVSIEHTDQQ